MKTIYTILSSTLVSVALLCSSCDSQLDQINPNAATEDTFWQTEEDFELALTSCYTPLKNPLEGGYHGTRGVMMRICRADEVEFRNDISDIYAAQNFTNSVGDGLTKNMFYQFYNALYRTNSVMQQLELKKGVFSDDFINKVKGECLFIRGYYLFQLGKEYRDAPLRLTASQSPSTFPLAKSSQAEIWGQAIQDLTTAASLLPVKNSVIGKPTCGAAYAVMGKIYLYQKEYEKAKATLEPLTKSPYTYRLVDDYGWNFDDTHENNEESIFELLIDYYSGGTDIWGNGELINSAQTTSRAREYAAPCAQGWYEAQPTQQIMDIFWAEKDKDGNFDYRARMNAAWNYPGCMYYSKTFQEQFPNNLGSYWILKYQNWWKEKEDKVQYSSINDRAIRYADVLLMLAECNLFTNNLQAAVDYINQIRSRANLNDYSQAMTKDAIFKDLEHQRAIEFFVEGERFYDLRRWGLLEERLKTCNTARYTQYLTGKQASGINKYDYYPIPSKEIETNPLCEPNEGW